jgi:hypothetical protein
MFSINKYEPSAGHAQTFALISFAKEMSTVTTTFGRGAQLKRRLSEERDKQDEHREEPPAHDAKRSRSESCSSMHCDVAKLETLPSGIIVYILKFVPCIDRVRAIGLVNHAFRAIVIDPKNVSDENVLPTCFSPCYARPYKYRHCQIIPSAMAVALGHRECIKNIHRMGVRNSLLIIAEAASQGRIDIMEFAKAEGLPCDDNAFAGAAVQGQSAVIEWLLRNGYVYSKGRVALCFYAGRGGNIATIEAINPSTQEELDAVMKGAGERPVLDAVKWADARGAARRIYHVVANALRRGDIESLNYTRESHWQWPFADDQGCALSYDIARYSPESLAWLEQYHPLSENAWMPEEDDDPSTLHYLQLGPLFEF